MNYEDVEIKRYYLLRPIHFVMVERLVLREEDPSDLPLHALDLVLRPSELTDPRRMKLRFSRVVDLRLSPASVPMNLAFLQIDSMHGRGWEGVNYAVSDEHGEQLTFMCAAFQAEVVVGD